MILGASENKTTFNFISHRLSKTGNVHRNVLQGYIHTIKPHLRTDLEYDIVRNATLYPHNPLQSMRDYKSTVVKKDLGESKTIDKFSKISELENTLQDSTKYLILTLDILLYHPFVILSPNFSYIILESDFSELKDRNLVERYFHKFVLFYDRFTDGVYSIFKPVDDSGMDNVNHLYTQDKPDTNGNVKIYTLSNRDNYCYSSDHFDIKYQNVLNIYKKEFPHLNFEILGTHNLSLTFSGTDMADIHLNINSSESLFLDESSKSDLFKGTVMVDPLNNNHADIVYSEGRIKVTNVRNSDFFHSDQIDLTEYLKRLKANPAIGDTRLHICDAISGLVHRKIKVGAGVVVSIIDRDFEGKMCDKTICVRPIDTRYSEFEYAVQDTQIYENRLVLYVFNNGKFFIIKILGVSGNIDDEIEGVLLENGVDYYMDKWDLGLNGVSVDQNCGRKDSLTSSIINIGLQASSVIQCHIDDSAINNVPDINSITNPRDILSCEQFGDRADFTMLDVCSIDPKGCTDIDDALHCVEYDEYIEVGVHIADVSEYVTDKDSPGLFSNLLDHIAKFRSTSVYLDHFRIDMLPPFLSSNICSLVQNKFRKVFSVIWKLERETFNILEYKITKGLINNRVSLSYEQANDLLEKETIDKLVMNNGNNYRLSNEPEESSTSCHVLNRLKDPINTLMLIADKLRSNRFKKDALELNRGETTTIHIPTHYLVEEFMLLANVTVAEFIYKHNPEYSLLRAHPKPSSIKIPFMENGEERYVDLKTGEEINRILREVEGQEHSKINIAVDDGVHKSTNIRNASSSSFIPSTNILKNIITRSLQQAYYYSSGEESNFNHFGLAADIYTHFTSPIRRYPDIVVHRTVKTILSMIRQANDRGELMCSNPLDDCYSAIDSLNDLVSKNACNWMNKRHRNAQNISRMATKVYTAEKLSPGKRLHGIITKIDENNLLSIFIEEISLEVTVQGTKLYSLYQMLNLEYSGTFEQFCKDRNMQFRIIN